MTDLQVESLGSGAVLRFRARLGLVTRVVEILTGQLRRLRTDFQPFEVALLLYEGLANAVQHGCNSDPEQWIRVALRLEPGGIRIVIRDPGPGFDWRRRTRRIPGPDQYCGRGLIILQAYSSAFHYNEAGNELLIDKDLGLGRQASTNSPNGQGGEG